MHGVIISMSASAGLLYVRFALDVVFMGIETPVRFHIPVVCRIVGKGERFFYPNRRPLVISYIINLKAIVSCSAVEALYFSSIVCSILSSNGYFLVVYTKYITKNLLTAEKRI